MGEIKLSPIWGYVLNSLSRSEGREGGRRREEGGNWVRQSGWGVVHRCWIGNSFAVIILH